MASNRKVGNDFESDRWRNITDYEGIYIVSDNGEVARIRTGKYRLLKPRASKKGYLKVNLSRNGKMKTVYVHRLVAQHFIDNPNGYDEINHLDENKTNNRASNLEWCSRKHNVNYGSRTSIQKHKVSKPVVCISTRGDRLIFNSVTTAGQATKVSTSNISACCKGKRKSAGGYRWEYQEGTQ